MHVLWLKESNTIFLKTNIILWRSWKRIKKRDINEYISLFLNRFTYLLDHLQLQEYLEDKE